MEWILRINRSNEHIDILILLTRIAIATLMISIHAAGKIELLLSGHAASFPSVFGLSSVFCLYLALSAELLGSTLILIGLWTRLAVWPPTVIMLVVIFVVLAKAPFAEKEELAMHYLLTYFVLFILGSGKYSVDYWWISRKIHNKRIGIRP